MSKSTVAKRLCKSLRKPSEAHAKALACLFPACSSARKFDPHEECVAAESHRRKKATGKRSKRLNVVMLEHLSSRVPKGIQRNKLKEDGHIIELAFNRSMTSKETMNVITDAFKDLTGGGKLQFLQANRDNTLDVHTQQNLDGNGVLNLAGSGSLYVRQMVESDDDLPNIELGQQTSSTTQPALPSRHRLSSYAMFSPQASSSPRESSYPRALSPHASSSATHVSSSQVAASSRMQLLQCADELIKELRVSCIVIVRTCRLS